MISNSIAHLAQQIQLTNQGWQDHLYLASLQVALIELNTAKKSEICDHLYSKYGLTLSDSLFLVLMNTLIVQEHAFESNEKYMLTDLGVKNLEDRLDEGVEIESSAKAAVFSILNARNYQNNFEIFFNEFCAEVLQELAFSLGAGLYNLFIGKSELIFNSSTILNYLDSKPEINRVEIEKILSEILSSSDKSIKTLVIRYLHAGLLLKTAPLPKKY